MTRCWFGHRWTKWQTYGCRFTYAWSDRTHEGDVQRRSCERCGLVKERWL